MHVRQSLKIVLLLFVPFFIMACQSLPQNPQHQANSIVPLEILYADKSLIGTQPAGPVWSNDGRHVAFLWNDGGFSFRDVWYFSLETKTTQRLTHHADNINSQQSQSKQPPGITEVVWLDADARQFAYVLNGQLYVKKANQKPVMWSQQHSDIRQISVSPKGRHLAYVAKGSLWLKALNTDNEPAQRLVERTHARSSISSYQWSDDGQNIVYKLTDGEHMPQREIHYYADGQLHVDQVTRAFPGEKTARYQVGLVTIDGANQQEFKRPDSTHYIWGYGLSSDGRRLFINSSDSLLKEHTVYLYDVDSGKRTVFYHEYDAKHLRPDWQVAWAPNDEGLVILTDKDGYLHLYHQVSAQTEAQPLTKGDWEIATFWVDSNLNQVYFIANKAHFAERQVYRVSLAGGKIERLSPTVSGTHELNISPDFTHATSLFSNDSTPLELYVMNLQSSEWLNVTKSPQPEFEDMAWAQFRYITFNSHIDGTPLQGRLSLPADFNPHKTYPLIVGSVYSDSVRNQFGGRTAHPTWGLDQYLSSQGYIVLNVNVRGSWGQGRLHNQGLHHSYGMVDIEDLHSGVKHLINEGYVDSERVGIWGSSYGGLMTMMSLFKKPGVYAAGIAGAPATNVAHAYPGQMWVMGEPTGDDQPQRYQNQSALYHTAGLADPLMIIHGTKDPVVLYSDTIAVIEKLIDQQKMFELVTLPSTSHGWDNEGNKVRLFAFKKMVNFFNRHLKED